MGWWPLEMSKGRLRLLRWCNSKESTCQGRRCRFHPWVGKIPWRRKWQPTPVFLPGDSHGQRSPAGYSPWGRKKSDTPECAHTHTHTKHYIGASSGGWATRGNMKARQEVTAVAQVPLNHTTPPCTWGAVDLESRGSRKHFCAPSLPVLGLLQNGSCFQGT